MTCAQPVLNVACLVRDRYSGRRGRA